MTARYSSKTIDLTGQKFNRLLVIRRSDRRRIGSAIWYCLCDCGNYTHAVGGNLRSGNTTSCGCAQKDRPNNTKHGLIRKHRKTYKTWTEMRQRCTNPNHKFWNRYGGRGISICKRWEDFSLFFADMGERPEGYSIDRINPDGNYEPLNCRWATPKQQAETNSGCFKPGSIPHNKK